MARPKPACLRCRIELRVEKQGIVIETELDPGRPYELYFADKLKCPECGLEIVYGYGLEPIATHFEADFQKTRDNYRQNWEFYTIP